MTKLTFWERKKFIPGILLVAVCFCMTTCTKGLQKEITVFKNDFEQADLSRISNGIITSFNNSKVLGRYNNGNFTVTLKDLPSHDLIQVTFELNIHDNWDGNSSVANNIDGPDIWKMKLDGETYINTTFSNTICNDQYCWPQSYPSDYPVNYAPKSNAYRTDLPGACHLKSQIGGTSMYKIVKIIKHTAGTFSLECSDELKQLNSPDPSCDESWSIDNITIKAIELR